MASSKFASQPHRSFIATTASAHGAAEASTLALRLGLLLRLLVLLPVLDGLLRERDGVARVLQVLEQLHPRNNSVRNSSTIHRQKQPGSCCGMAKSARTQEETA